MIEPKVDEVWISIQSNNPLEIKTKVSIRDVKNNYILYSFFIDDEIGVIDWNLDVSSFISIYEKFIDDI